MKKVKVSNWSQKLSPCKMRKTTASIISTLLLFGTLCIANVSYAGKSTVDAIPASLNTWLKQQSQITEVREDGLITFQNKQQYIIIQPAELPAENTEIKIESTLGEDQAEPDIYILSNGFYLVRIVTGDNGEKSLPLLENFPQILRTGHIPKNFHVPKNLYIPNDWKSVFIDRLELIDDNEVKLAKNQNTMLWLSPNENKLYWYQPKEAELANQWLSMSLPCKPINKNALLVLETNEIVIACQDKNNLYRFTPGGRSEAFKVDLPATPTDMVMDSQTQTIYVAYSGYELPIPPVKSQGGRGGWWKIGQKTKEAFQDVQTVFEPPSVLTVYNTRLNKLENDISLERPIKQLYYSGFRQQLVGLSVDEDAFFFIPVSTPTQQQRFRSGQQFTHFTVDKDKLLWIAGRDNNQDKLFAFDLRWQELYPMLDLKNKSEQLLVDDSVLYFVNPTEISRWDVASQEWLSPIAVGNTCMPNSIQPALDKSKLYVTYSNCADITSIDLGQTQASSKLLTPKTVSIGDHWQLYSALPSEDSTAQLAKLKLQDGRILLQNGNLPQRVKWLSVRRDQTANQNQKEQAQKQPPEAQK